MKKINFLNLNKATLIKTIIALSLLPVLINSNPDAYSSDTNIENSHLLSANNLNPFYMPFLWAPSINTKIPKNGNIVVVISEDNNDGSTSFYHVEGQLQKTPLGYFAVWNSDNFTVKNTEPAEPPVSWIEPPEFYGLSDRLYTDKSLDPEEITNLVFSGGGIKGLAYAGALEALEELNVLNNITRIAGASAGAITAGLLSVGFTPYEIKQELKKQNFADFLDSYDGTVNLPKVIKEIKDGTFDIKKNLPMLLYIFGDEVSHYGICMGNEFRKWLVDRFTEKGFNENTTFQQLYEQKQIELFVVMCNSNYSKTVIANHETYPDLSIVDAIKASMSIPFVFSPDTIEGNQYVDGGTMYNYPVDIFDDDTAKGATLGFILSSRDTIFNPPRREINNLGNLIEGIFNAIMNVSYESIFRTGNAHRTVFIDCGDIGTLDFDLDESQKNALVESGKDATLQYFLPST